MTRKRKVGICGAGMTGLSAAKHLLEKGYDVQIFEAEDHLGGLAKDCSKDGFVVDLGPHYIFETLAKKAGLSPSESSKFPYYEELYRSGKFYTFPFGMMKNPRYALSVGTAYALSLVRPKKTQFNTLEEALYRNYGKTFTNEILGPLLKKWSGKSPDGLSLDLSKRLEPANLDQILFFVKKIVFRISNDFKDRSRHWVYPHGGVEAIFDRLTQGFRDKISLNEPVQSIQVTNDKVTQLHTSKGEYTFDDVISTLPINKLNAYVQGTDVFKPYEALNFRAVRFLFLRYNCDRILKKLWTWFPQDEFIFYRISEPKNVLESLGPKGQTQLTVEIACNHGDTIWNANTQTLANDVHKQIVEAYGLKDIELLEVYEDRAQYVYPVLEPEHDELRKTISYQTPIKNLYWGGRGGQFKYIFLEECFGIGKKCADLIDKKYQASA